MKQFKIPGVSFSLNRALGITQAKQNLKGWIGKKSGKDGVGRHLRKKKMISYEKVESSINVFCAYGYAIL